MDRGVLVVLMAFIATGCDERIDASCSSQDAKNLISEMISSEAGKIMSDSKDKNGETAFPKEKIDESIKKVAISIEDIRTTNRDPNSTKASCAGTLLLTADADIMDKAIKAREKADLGTLSDFADKLDVKSENNKFSKSIEYYVQPTDDGKKIYAALDKNSRMETMLSEITTSYLIFYMIEENEKTSKTAIDKKINLNGTWESGNDNEFYKLSLEKNGFEINAKLNVGYGDCSGEINGKLVNRNGRMAIVSNEYEQECIVDTSFSGDDVEISEGENCSYYHGASCGFYGTLHKQTN